MSEQDAKKKIFLYQLKAAIIDKNAYEAVSAVFSLLEMGYSQFLVKEMVEAAISDIGSLKSSEKPTSREYRAEIIK